MRVAGNRNTDVFKTDSSSSAAGANNDASLILATAAAVSPVNELNAINRAALCRTASVMHVQRNDVLKPENAHRWMIYLVDGSLTLYNGRDEVGTLVARTGDALQPLFLDKSAYQSVRTPALAKVVKFGREQIDILLREQQKNAVHVIDVETGELENLLFDDIIVDIRTNNVHLATPPSVGSQIAAVHRSIQDIPELSEVIQADPGITAHIVNAANQADNSGSDATQSIRGAISRLGVESTQRMVADLLAANTLKPANDLIGKRFTRYVRRTTLSAAIVQVLSQQTPELKAEVAALVALTADIGELLVLTVANRHADRISDREAFSTAIDSLRPVVSGWLLSNWRFADFYVDAAHKSRDWYRNHNGEITYTDLVTASLLIIQAQMPDSEHSSIPSADNLLLARRLQQAGIDLKSPGDIVKRATSKLAGVQSLLKKAS